MAAASFDDYTPNLMRNMAQQQHDKVTMILAAIGFVRPLVKYGRPYAEALFYKVLGKQEVDMDEVFANVDWPALQDQTPPTEDSSGSRRGWRRLLGFDEVQLTPQQQQQQQNPQVQEPERQQPQQQQQQTIQGNVATQVQRLETGQLLLPVDGGDDSRQPTAETGKQSEEQIVVTDEQNTYKQTRAKLDAGKQPLPNFDPWQSDNSKGQAEMMLRTERARVSQLETELRRMQKTIEDLQYKSDPQPTPIRRDIGTPTIPIVNGAPSI